MRTSPNWLLGNSVETGQWESGNSSVAFPFADDSLPDGFPCDWIVDALVVVPSNLYPDAKVTVGCVHVGPSMVSAFVMVDGRPALYCNARSPSFEPFAPIVMTSVMNGISGMLTFGGVEFGARATYRLNVPLSETAVLRPIVGRLEKFVQPERGAEASGYVSFELPSGVTMSVSENGDDSVIRFEADESVRERVPAPCSEPEGPKTMSVPVRNINGVVPDENGRIAVVFIHDEDDLEGLK